MNFICLVAGSPTTSHNPYFGTRVAAADANAAKKAFSIGAGLPANTLVIAVPEDAISWGVTGGVTDVAAPAYV